MVKRDVNCFICILGFSTKYELEKAEEKNKILEFQ